MNVAEEFYKDNIEKVSKESNALSAKVNIIGWSRLVVVLLCALLDYILYRPDKVNLIIIVTMVFIIIFLVLVFYHNNIFEYKRKLDLLIAINGKGLKRLSGQFRKFKDNGSEYLDDAHSFINDLDVFGNNSIFQYINDTVTKGGRGELVKVLKKEKNLSESNIKERQDAIRELGEKAVWRQKLIVEGNLKKSKN